MANFGQGYRYHITGLFHDEMGFPTQRQDEIEQWLERINNKINRHLDEIVFTESDIQSGARIGIVTYGASARSARHAVKIANQKGVAVSLLILLTIWPFAESQVEALGEQVDRLIVPEMNQGQIALEVERLVGRRKVTRISQANGEMVTPQMILTAIEG
jgi:2-oxoglutarate ferredoxin oxidoreductase subunit alpha